MRDFQGDEKNIRGVTWPEWMEAARRANKAIGIRTVGDLMGAWMNGDDPRDPLVLRVASLRRDNETLFEAIESLSAKVNKLERMICDIANLGG